MTERPPLDSAGRAPARGDLGGVHRHAGAGMTATPTQTQIVLAWLAGIVVIACVIVGVVWYGVSEKVLGRFWQNIIDRPGGPMTFRFILQPAMAALAALHDSMRDVRLQRTPDFQTVLTSRVQPVGRLREGLVATARIILLGLAMDAIYQLIAYGRFYPAEAATIAMTLAFLPYLILRGPFAHAVFWWRRRQLHVR